MMQIRRQKVEHPFGTLKSGMGLPFPYLNTRPGERVKMSLRVKYLL